MPKVDLIAGMFSASVYLKPIPVAPTYNESGLFMLVGRGGGTSCPCATLNNDCASHSVATLSKRTSGTHDRFTIRIFCS